MLHENGPYLLPKSNFKTLLDEIMGQIFSIFFRYVSDDLGEARPAAHVHDEDIWDSVHRLWAPYGAIAQLPSGQ